MSKYDEKLLEQTILDLVDGMSGSYELTETLGFSEEDANKTWEIVRQLRSENNY